MSALALRLSSNHSYVSALTKQNKTYSVESDNQQDHSEKLINIIDQCLSQAQLTISDLKYILVDTGPGSFTPIRTAICTCLGLSAVNNITTIGINTFDGIYYNYTLNKKESNIVIIYLNNNHCVYQNRDQNNKILYTKSNQNTTFEEIQPNNNCEIVVCDDGRERKYKTYTYTAKHMLQYFIFNKVELVSKQSNIISPYYVEQSTS